MSKLIEALKRAEELRKLKRAQEEALKAKTSDAIAPVNEIEAALIAEEARMAALRVRDLYEQEKQKKTSFTFYFIFIFVIDCFVLFCFVSFLFQL